jgi:small subunit ribosomal protein S3Ae
MAVGKNKKLGKARKGGRKKAADPFLKKESYEIRTPACFPVKSAGKTIATKTQGIKVARDTLMGRIVEVSLGDLKENTEEEAFRKFKLKVEDVNGFNCLTQFHGMDLTTDKLRSLVRKWQTLIEAHVDIRTSDGYSVRLFGIGFTRKHKDHVKKTAYASAAQIRNIRKKMKEVMNRETTGVDLHQLVDKLTLETIGKEIEKHTQAIYPLQNCLIRKVKMLRAPKADAQKLVDLAGGADVLAKASGVIAKGLAPAQVGAVVVAASLAGNAEDTGVKVAAKPAGKADAKADAPAAKDDKPAAAAKEDKPKADKPAKEDKKAATPKEDKPKADKPAKADKPKEDKKGADKPKDDKKAAKPAADKKGGDDKKKK